MIEITYKTISDNGRSMEHKATFENENLDNATHKDNVNNPVTVKKRRAYWQIYWQKKNPTCYLR